MAIAFNHFPGNGQGRWWYLEQAKIIDSESVFPRLPKAFDICTRKVKHNLFGKFVEYYNLVSNKTCIDNRMLWKQRGLFSGKSTVNILSWGDGKHRLEELRKSFKLTFFWQVRRKRLRWKWFGTVTSRSNGWQFFPTDSPNLPKGWQLFSNG